MLKKILLTALISTIASSAAFADDQGSVTVHISGLRNSKGVVRIALFNSADSYTSSKGAAGNEKGALKKAAAPINSQQASYSFDGLPYGDYAVKMFHDEDNSGKFETGMFGIPKVEYGFSNNAVGKMGPAPYDKAKFTLNQPSVTVNISAHHGP